MIKNEAVLILDFGGQYSQLIARRVRDCNVFCEIKPYNISAEEIQKNGYKGIIFSGGPNSVYAENAPKCDTNLFHLGIPVLGICYGAQLIAATLGGTVDNSEVKEYGNTEVTYHCDSVLFQDIDKTSIAWMSHTDYISALPAGFTATATTSHCPVAAMEHSEKKIFALQFHPEVEHSVAGNQILKNFLYHVCDCKGDWEMASFAKMSIESLKEQIGDKKVLCALSGGVDSSVAALLVHKAIGKNLTCIFVDHGLLRKNEGDEVEEVFRKQFDMNLIRVNAQERALMGGMRGVGFGALLGLDDFRKDAFATGYHAWLLQRKYPHAEIAFSCPRLRPIINNDRINPMDVHEAQLLQVVCAYRLLMPFASITISTRECARVRDNLVQIAATKISAGVSTGIGEHVDEIEEKGDDQFEISDGRSVDEVYQALVQNHLQPVMNDYVYV